MTGNGVSEMTQSLQKVDDEGLRTDASTDIDTTAASQEAQWIKKP